MTQKISSWQRLEAVINYTKMSTNAFAKSISLKRSENLYQIKKGNNGISKELADSICEKYGEINKLWLLTGDGTMFIDSNDTALNTRNGIPQNSIPYYDLDLMSVVESRITIRPNHYIKMPLLGDCDFAVKFSGGAMSPIITQGALVFLKRVDTDNILFNEIYLVVTTSYATIRYVGLDESNEQNFLLVPSNIAHQTMSVKKGMIKELYIVKGTFHPFI